METVHSPEMSEQPFTVWCEKKQPPFFKKLETYLSSYQLHLNSGQVITGWNFREMALLISSIESEMGSLIC